MSSRRSSNVFDATSHLIFVVSNSGQIDVLINNAGYLLGGAIEENTFVLISTEIECCRVLTCAGYRDEEIRAQFDTNFFGVINLTNALLPHFH